MAVVYSGKVLFLEVAFSCVDQVFLNRFYFILLYFIRHCFLCRPSDSTVSEDAGTEHMTVATLSLTFTRSKQSARSRPVLSATYARHKYPSIPTCTAKIQSQNWKQIYIFPRSICLFCCRKYILGIYKSLADTSMWKLGLRPCNSQKRNT